MHDPGQGGGRVVGECGHFVDFCQYLIGSLPVKVMAMASGGEQPGALVDTLSIVIGYEDGSTATVHYFASGDKAFPKERVEVFGDGRVGVLDNFRSVQLSPGKRHRAMNQQKGFAEEAAAFVEGVRAGRLPIPMDVLLSTSRVTFAALRSLEEGGQVSV